ncbi:DUF3298 and DUF4163 domain-containing protein [Ectobacillus ponti]|uniref:DUF3298 and DUF4163 domain-containing protein n=1 Tax=Ectobacillus ponti TaxID=2961894 RepID=A0AA42BRS2_9BACI|nr:DUF3298 and DUF4163 domain-containing protein [Ectobacillus ponti]MCP8969804.1 DUF3298 and DUF4163 domain-containing protein [Ectobacillus ponti]
MKWVLRIALILYFLFVIVPEYVLAGPVSAPPAAQVDIKKQEDTNDYFQYQLNTPQFSGLSSSSFAEKLNAYYETNIQTFKKKLKKDAKQAYEETQDPASFHPYVVNVDHKVTYNAGPLLSLYVVYYQYTGGAHGMYEWRPDTFDIDKKKELALKDLFRKDSNYMEVIVQHVKEQIEQNPNAYFPDAAAQAEKATTFKFFLEPDHLVIYFPLYEIAPFAAGIPQFRIPYTLLSGQLKEKYADALVGHS